MLLSPQHFQLAVRRAESLTTYLLDAAAPLAWGVRRLRFDTSLLLAGVFRVIELEAVLPDGLVVMYPAADDPVLEIDLKLVEPDLLSAPVAIHIAVAEHTAGPGGPRRYRSVEAQPVADDNTGDSEIAVPRLRPAPILYPTQGPSRPPPSKYVSLPIARIVSRDETYTLDSYEPPRLTLSKDSRLHERAQATAVRLRERALALGETLQSTRLQGIEARDAANQLRSLIRSLPRLEALLNCGIAHPFSVYLTFCDVVGDLAVIGGQLNLPMLGGYEHRDPLPSFIEVTDYVERALAALRETVRSIRFTRAEPGRFSLPIQSAWLREHLLLGVRTGPGQAPDVVGNWVEDAIIASASRIRSTRENRVMGADRQVVSDFPELDLVAPPNVLLYRVTVDPYTVVADEELQIVGRVEEHSRGEPAEILLYLPAHLFATAGARDRA